MHGSIYREVFPTFLAKKSYDWWITKRRMEIYTKISKRKDLKWSRQKQGKIRITHGVCEIFAHLKKVCELRTPFAQLKGGVRNSRTPGGVVFRKPYLPCFSSKSCTVWSVGFLTSKALKWYIACREWTSGSTPKVPTKTAAAVLCFPPCFSLLFSFDWLVLMIQKDVKTLKLATNMIRRHC